MQVSEEQRRALHERLREHLDEATATLLLEVTVPANIEFATRTDLDVLRADVLLRISEVNGNLSLQMADLARRLGETDSRLGAQIGGVEARLSGRIDELDARLSARIDELDARLSARIDGLDARLSARIDGLNGRVDDLSTRIEELGKQVAGVEKAVGDLGATLSRQLITRVVPLLLAGVGVFVGLATWLG